MKKAVQVVLGSLLVIAAALVVLEAAVVYRRPLENAVFRGSREYQFGRVMGQSEFHLRALHSLDGDIAACHRGLCELTDFTSLSRLDEAAGEFGGKFENWYAREGFRNGWMDARAESGLTRDKER